MASVSTSCHTAGTLTQANSKDGAAIFGLTDLKPGDTLHGDLTITNTGSLPAAFRLTETVSTNAFSDDLLALTITDTTTGSTVYSGTFGGLEDGTANDLGTYAPGGTGSYRFTVTLSKDATNAEQGRSAGASYQWDAVQLDGDTRTQ